MEEEPATESESGTILRLLLESMRSGSEDESDGDDDEIARIDHDSPRLEELTVRDSAVQPIIFLIASLDLQGDWS